jgi:hypothetical protein
MDVSNKDEKVEPFRVYVKIRPFNTIEKQSKNLRKVIASDEHTVVRIYIGICFRPEAAGLCIIAK